MIARAATDTGYTRETSDQLHAYEQEAGERWLELVRLKGSDSFTRNNVISGEYTYSWWVGRLVMPVIGEIIPDAYTWVRTDSSDQSFGVYDLSKRRGLVSSKYTREEHYAWYEELDDTWIRQKGGILLGIVLGKDPAEAYFDIANKIAGDIADDIPLRKVNKDEHELMNLEFKLDSLTLEDCFTILNSYLEVAYRPSKMSFDELKKSNSHIANEMFKILQDGGGGAYRIGSYYCRATKLHFGHDKYTGTVSASMYLNNDIDIGGTRVQLPDDIDMSMDFATIVREKLESKMKIASTVVG